MGAIEELVASKPESVHPLLEELRGLVRRSLPEAREELKWGQPVYSGDQLICYLNATAAYATLGFYRGVELEVPKGLLEGEGKRLRHVKVRSPEEPDRDALTALLQAAGRLDAAR